MKIIWPLILLSYLSLFVFGITDNIRGPLFLDILNDFKVTDSEGSWMFALGSISGFFASRFSRFLLYRINRKLILQMASLLMTCSLMGLALSPSFMVFLVFSFFFGISSGVIGLIPNILVPLGSPESKKQQLLSGLHAMYGVASLIAPLLVAGMNHYFQNWRYIFGAIALAPFSLFLYSLHSSHKGHHLEPEKRTPVIKGLNFIHSKPQIYLALMLSFAVSAEVMMSSRLALFMRRVWGFDLEQSSLYVTYFFIALLLSRLLFTALKLRLALTTQLAISLITTASMITCGLMIHPFFLVLAGFCISPFFPLTISLISNEFPEDLDSAVSMIMAVDSFMLAFMHLFIGKMTDLYGINIAFYYALIFLALALFMSLSYPRIFKKIKT